MSFLIWKWRKYPIKRDERGRSLRQQAFELFDEKHRPTEIYKQQLLPAKLNTLLRYYQDWKKKGDHLSYRITKKVMEENPDFTEQMIKTLSEQLEMPVNDITEGYVATPDYISITQLQIYLILHSYDYMSLLMPCFDIPVSLGDLFRRIVSIYDPSYIAGLNKLFEEE